MRDDLRRIVFVPLAAAAITGALSGLFVLIICAWRGWPAVWAALAAPAVALYAWLAWSAKVTRILEYRLAPGLPRIQAASPARAMTQTAMDQTVDLRIHREDEGGYLQGTFLYHLPGGEKALAALANLVISGQSLTTSQVCASGLLGRADWEQLRDRFVFAGLLRWRGGNRAHGCEVTGRGLAVFRRLADPTRKTPPTPPL